MHLSKLIRVLKEVSKEDVQGFVKYLESPLFHRSVGVKKGRELFMIIKSHHPLFESSGLNKERVYKQLYPKSEYKEGKLEKLMSRLLKLLQEFIVFNHSDIKNELYQLRVLEKYYRNNQLHGMANQCEKKYRKQLGKINQRDATYYYDVFAIDKQIATYQTHFPDTKKTLQLPTALENLDQYYIFEKLEMAFLMLSFHRFVAPVDFGKSLDLLEQLTPLLEQNYFEVPLIKVYYRAYRMLSADEATAEKKYLAFEQELENNFNQIPETPLKSLNAIIRNYCIMKYHDGVGAYLERTFRLYQEHLEKGYLYSDGKIFPATMGNIVVFGSRVKAFDWVLKFLKEHKDKITGTNNPDRVYRFNLANYHFYTAQYDKVLDHLNETHDHPHYKLWAKELEIKVYYEQRHVLLTSKIDAFKIYVYRLDLKYVTKKRKEGSQHFIDIIKQICLPRTFQNNKRIDKLIAKINTLQYVVDKEWLIEKLEELR